MSKHIRRFTAAVSLTLILAVTPAVAAPSRDSGNDRDRTSIVQIIKRIAQRIFGVTPNTDLTGPNPAPTPTPEP
ncbi:MAG TPA: hypothetical protein VNA69_04115 [Thermoanaerobaculia bacterium]|nr:hypothetical protein [Thermoanaerobaculia bacterium]